MGFADTIRQAFQKNNIGTTLGETAASVLNQPEVKSTLEEVKQNQPKQYNAWNYAYAPKQEDEDYQAEFASFLDNVEKAYDKASNQGDNEELEEELSAAPVKDTRLMPAFNTNNSSGYNPSESALGKLDQLTFKDSENPVTQETNSIYENMEGFTDQTGDRALPHFWNMLTAMSEANQAAPNDVPLAARANRDIADDANRRAFDEMGQWLTSSREAAVDDGTQDRRNLTSNYMTGEQYINYRNAGIPGLDIEEIDPNTIYNKRNEMLNNGFAPYIPDDVTYNRMVVENAADQPTRWGAALRNYRNDNIDYGATYNGKTYSGREIEDEMIPWLSDTQKMFDDPNSAIHDPNADHTNMTPYGIYSRIEFEDGTTVDIPLEGYEITQEPVYADENGTFLNEYGEPQPMVVRFANGASYEFDTQADIDSIFDKDKQQQLPLDGNTPEQFASYWMPNYVDKNGNLIDYDTVYALTSDDENVDYDYGLFNQNKPTRKLDDFITDEGFNWGDTVPKFADIALSSAPYFYMPVSVPYGLSNAHVASITGDPMSMDENGNVQPLASDLDNDRYLMSVSANAAMPLTEIGFGNIGSGLRGPFQLGTGALSRRFEDRAWMPVAGSLFGAAGEGGEEIGGNIVEEATRNGLRNWYANNMRATEDNLEEIERMGYTVDPLGNVYDPITGRPIKDPEHTTAKDRWNNFWTDAPEAVIGGTGLGMGMSLLQTPSTIKQIRNINNKHEGYYTPLRYIEPTDIEVSPVPPELLDYWNREE